MPPPKLEVVQKSSLPSSRIPRPSKVVRDKVSLFPPSGAPTRPPPSAIVSRSLFVALRCMSLPVLRPVLPVPRSQPLVRRFPSVFPRRRSPDVFFALRTSPQSAPRTTPYRIPRFKCTCVFASPMSNSSTGNLSFNVRTPCPSHTLMVRVRRLARRASVVEDPDLSQSPRAEVVKDSIVSETEVVAR